jgi:hypothetical protein
MRSLTALILTLSGLSLAACGGANPNSAGTQKAASDVTNSGNKALRFSECMRTHGVPNFPDLTGGRVNLSVQRTASGTTVDGVAVNGPAFQSAMQACHADLPNGGQPTSQQSSAMRATALKFSQCMRSHGVPNFPDPHFSGGHLTMQLSPSSGIDPSSPAFQSAQQACQPLLRKDLNGGGTHVGGGV